MIKHKLVLSPQKFELEDISKEEIYDNLQRKISECTDYWYRIQKAIETLKDTNVDMPSTLLIEVIGYAIHILQGKEVEDE